MNKIEVFFGTCSPVPTAGYDIKYRVQGSDGGYIDAGNFFISPAIFYDTVNPAGTCYEGFIRSDCNSLFGTSIYWNSCESGVTPVEVQINWNYVNDDGGGGRFKILVNSVLVVNITTTQSGSITASAGDFVEVIVQTNVTGMANTDISGPYNNTTSSDHITTDDFTALAGVYTINGSSN